MPDIEDNLSCITLWLGIGFWKWQDYNSEICLLKIG